DHLDVVIADDTTARLEARVHEGIYVLFQGHTVLQAERHGYSKAMHDRLEGRAHLLHVYEDVTDATALVPTRPHVDVVARDGGFLGVSGAAVGQLLAAHLALRALRPDEGQLHDPVGDGDAGVLLF